jgi:ferric-dicitrate binding protein FerR (iron transport regulator)
VSGSGAEPPVGGELPWELVDRYFSGTGTAGECARIVAWERAAAGRREELDALHAIWARGGAQPTDTPTWDTERALASLVARMHGHFGRDEERTNWHDTDRASHVGDAGGRAPAPGLGGLATARLRARPWPFVSRHIVASSVGIISIAMSGVILWQRAPDTASQSIREFDTPPGARSMVSLRDGSILTLGPATRLRVPPEFGRVTRTVELEGEALFTVVHDSRHPFLVRTARAVVRDVGTTFTVVAYAKDPGVEVAVAEGEVSVAGSALKASDVGTIGATGLLTVRHRADVRPYVAWSQGSLVFIDTPLREVMRVLDRTYDLQITLADSALGAQLITATFANQPPDVVLDDITAIVGAAYEWSSRSVVIRRRARAPAHPGGALSPRAALANLSHGRREP